MLAELIALEGPLDGQRFPLAEEIWLGSAPSSGVVLSGPEVAWRHCVIREVGNAWVLLDEQSGFGTRVNGIRVRRQVLKPDDQIRIGPHAFSFRRAQPEPRMEARASKPILQACGLLLLFRALEQNRDEPQSQIFEDQILKSIGELVPFERGSVLVAGSTRDLRVEADRRWGRGDTGFPFALEVANTILERGTPSQEPGRVMGWPLFYREEITGIVLIHGLSDPGLAVDVLFAVGNLAGAAIENARDVYRLREMNSVLREQAQPQQKGLPGQSVSTQQLNRMIERLAARDTTVLILGESGTGKELVARALHSQSARAENPFLAINCAALTDTLLESELFGHEKGAFTGAVAQKKGKLEAAGQGTVFLDEIGELAPALQAKLLRVLQQREFERVGSTRTIPVEARFVAATNRDLAAEVKAGRFREDLYHRLGVVVLRTSPLRDRAEDIPLIAQHLLARVAARCGRRVNGFSDEAMVRMRAYPWPGNVRELENAIERAVVLGDAETVQPEDLPETVAESQADAERAGGYSNAVGSARRDSIIQAWRQAGGDYRIAAGALGIHPNSLLRLIRTLGLRDSLAESLSSSGH